jgi:uncharacterized protein YcbX
MNNPPWDGDHHVSTPSAATPRLAAVQRFPIKSLDAEPSDRATIVPDGGLAGDRKWAIVDRPPDAPFDPAAADVTGSGDYINGKKTDAVHRIRSAFIRASDGGPAVELYEHGAGPNTAQRFELYDGDPSVDEAGVHADLNDWLSVHFGRAVSLRRDSIGHHDDRDRHGPSIVSTATLREVAAWFDIGLESARRRFRATLEVGGVPPFWEDRLFDDEESVVAFRIGDVTIEGVHPCQRCVVPGRDPDTGAETPGFRDTFIQRREETLPPWTDSDRFDHPFRLMVNTRVPESAAGGKISVGDPIEIIESRQA